MEFKGEELRSAVDGVFWSESKHEWRRKFVDRNNKGRVRSFSANKWGFYEAKQLAETCTAPDGTVALSSKASEKNEIKSSEVKLEEGVLGNQALQKIDPDGEAFVTTDSSQKTIAAQPLAVTNVDEITMHAPEVLKTISNTTEDIALEPSTAPRQITLMQPEKIVKLESSFVKSKWKSRSSNAASSKPKSASATGNSSHLAQTVADGERASGEEPTLEAQNQSIEPTGETELSAENSNIFNELHALSALPRPVGLPKRVNVGAKPLSGVRGIYFQQGLWKIKYKGDRETIVRVFPYKTANEMRSQFRLARKLLKEIIDKGRQLHDSDGEGLSQDENQWENHPKVQRIKGCITVSKVRKVKPPARSSKPELQVSKNIKPALPPAPSQLPAGPIARRNVKKLISHSKSDKYLMYSSKPSGAKVQKNFFETFIYPPNDRESRFSFGPRHDRQHLYALLPFVPRKILGRSPEFPYPVPKITVTDPWNASTVISTAIKSGPYSSSGTEEDKSSNDYWITDDAACTLYSPTIGLTEDERIKRIQSWTKVAGYPFSFLMLTPTSNQNSKQAALVNNNRNIPAFHFQRMKAMQGPEDISFKCNNFHTLCVPPQSNPIGPSFQNFETNCET